MSRILSHEHKSWEDWTVILLGAAVVCSPALDPTMATPVVVLNAILIGFMLIVFAISEFELAERWVERLQFALGLWLLVSPFVLGYMSGGTLHYWHFAFGAAVVAMSMLELWQDDDPRAQS